MKKTLTTRLLALLLCVATLATVTPLFAAAATTITEIKITNADVTPYIGEKAGDWLDYTLPENCHFTMAQHYWYNETVGGSTKADEVFAAGSKYDLCWRCEAESGYTFDAGTTVTINGSTTLLDDSFTKVYGDDSTVFLVWTKPTEPVEKPATVIDKIEITNAIVTPYIGTYTGSCLNYSLPENCHFTVDDHYWYNENANRSMTSGDVFAAGLEYDLCWICKADSGYTFSDEAAVTLNGSTALLDIYTSVDTGDPTLFYVWTKPTEAQEPPALASGINLLVGKTWVTGANAADVLGDGTVSYDDETKTLTLDNAYITDYVYVTDAWAYCSIYADQDITIDLVGNNVVDQAGTTLDKNCYAILIDGSGDECPPVLTGDGNLEVYSADTTMSSTALHESTSDMEIAATGDLWFEAGTCGETQWDYSTPITSTSTHFLYSGANAEHDLLLVSGKELGVGCKAPRELAVTLYTAPEDPGTEAPASCFNKNGELSYFFLKEGYRAARITAKKAVIDKIEIDGFCDPVVGGTASDYTNLAVPGSAPYRIGDGSLYWHNDTDDMDVLSTDMFEKGKSYSLRGMLVADEGFIFAEDTEVLLNGGEYPFDESWTEVDGFDAHWFYFGGESKEAVEPTVIDKIEIDGFCDAVIGGKVGDYFHLTLPEDVPYYFDYSYWYNDTDDYGLSSGDTFEAGKFYSLGGGLKADEGYVFAEHPTILLNGGAYGVFEEYTERSETDASYFYVWSESKEAVEPIVIDKIEINGFCDPVVGGKAGDYFHLTFPGDAPYHFDYSWWHNDTDDYEVSSGDMFEAGKFYSLGGMLVADPGYIFAENPEVLLNGGDYPIDESWTKIDSTDANWFYIWGESKEAVEPIVIDTIEINGFSDPVAGGKVGDYLNITIPEDAHFSFLGTGMHWYDDAADNFIYDAEALFKAGKSYSIGGELVADPGYVFAENPTVLLNGGAYPVDTDHSFTYIGSPRSFKLWTASKKATTPTEPTEPKPTTEPTKTKAPTATEPKATTEPTVKPTVAPTESQPTAKPTVAPTESQPTATEPVVDPTATATGTEAPSFILYGDANDDGVVNMKDVLAVRKYVASLPITINMLTADANADGVVNMKDVLAIRKYIAGLVDHLGA